MAKKNKKQLEEELNRYGREYEIAKRKGDRQGMAAAHAKANQTRKQAGWTYDKKSGKTFEKVSPIQKQGRLVNSSQNIALAKSGANPVKAVKQQPTKDRVLTGSQGKALSKSYADKKQQKQELKNVSEKVKESWEKDRVRRKRNENTAKVNQFFANAAKAQGKPIKQLPQSPAMTAQEVSRSLPAIKQIEKDLYDTRIRKEQMVKELPKAEQALRAAAHGLVGSLASAGETAYISARDQVSQWKDFGSDYFTTPLSKLEQNWKEKYADNAINPYGFASQNMRESQYLRDLAVRDMGKIGTFLTDTGISIAQNAPSMALSALNPLAGAAVMGTSAAGAKAYELQQQGISAHDALSRGLAAGAIEGVTEKFSIDHFLKALNNGGLKNTVKNIARQAGVEASEESASYVLNYLADKVAQDPNAAFSMEALLQNAAGGALSGGVFGGAGSVAGAFRPAVSQSSPMGASKSSSFDIADFQIPADTFSERNYQHSAPKNQHIPDFEAQWNRYNQMGQAGLPFEQVIPYETGTPVDYETAYSAHASGYNDFIERTKQTATRILSGNEADLPEIADAVVSPPARQMLEQGLKLTLSQNASQAVRQVREAAKITSNPANSQALGVSENGQKNNVSGETQYKIKTLPDGRRYVKADREVITGDDPKAWSKQAEQFINDVIRNGEDITVFTQDGFEVKITDRSAYKLSDPHVQSVQKIGRALLPDADLGAKMRAAGHIDELLEISRTNGYRPDKNGNHANDIGEKGFDYFSAYFEDADGQFYQVKMSAGVNEGAGVALNDDIDTAYSIGEMQKRSPMHRRGSSNSPFVSGAQSGVQRTSSDSSIVQNQSAGNPQTQTVTQMQQTPATRQTGVIENRAAHTVDKRTVDTIDRIAKRTGFSVEFVQGVPEAGSYQDGKIRINTESGDPVRQIFVHELTHYLEQSGEYGALSQAILTEIDEAGALSEVREYVREQYAENGHALDRAGLDREVVAWFAEENLFTDERAIGNLAHKNRSLFQKIRNWLHDLRVKLRGTAEEKFILRTEKLYQKALNSVNGQKNNASGETQYRIGRTTNGDSFVDVDDTSLDGQDRKTIVNILKRIVQQGFTSHVTTNGQHFKINSKTANEWVWSRDARKLYRKNVQAFYDKANSFKYADELLEASRKYRSELPAHPRKDNFTAFGRGEVLFRADGRGYQADIVVGITKKGEAVLYDIVNLQTKKITEALVNTPLTNNLSAGGTMRSRASVGNSIAQNQNGSNTQTQTVTQMQQNVGQAPTSTRVLPQKKSGANGQRAGSANMVQTGQTQGVSAQSQGTQGTQNQGTQHKVSGSESINDIIRRNREQSETIRRLKQQLAEAEDGVVTDPQQVKGLVNGLLHDYSSRMSREARARLTSDIQEIYDDIANNTAGNGDIQTRIRQAARTILDHSAVLSTDTEADYKAIRTYLKDNKLTISEQDRKDIADYDAFRKSLFGTIKMGNDGLPVDVAYAEMTELFGEGLFPSDITHPADQLEHIADTIRSLKPVLENPHTRDMQEATRILSDEIYERFFELREHPTRGRRQQRELEAVRAQANERLARALEQERRKRDKEIEKIKARRTTQTELRRKITQHASKLSSLLLKPSDTRHIVEQGRQTKDGQTVSMKKTVAALLETINLESQYSIDPETGKRIYTGETEGQLTKRTEQFRELRKQYQAILADDKNTMVVDPDLLYHLDTLSELSDTKLADYTTEQLYTLWNTIRAVESSITNENKLFSQMRYSSVKALADQITNDNRREVQKSERGKFQTMLSVDMKTPYHFFRSLGKGGEVVFRELERARGQYILDTDWSIRYLKQLKGEIDTSNWSGEKAEKITFQTESGQQGRMTRAQRISLYLLSKRKQGMQHLIAENGGIVMKEKGTETHEAIRLTKADIQRMTADMTAEERHIAEGISQAMQHFAAWGNEASMKLYGYEKFGEKNYYPIQTDSNSRKDENPQRTPGEAGYRVKNAGMTKSTDSGARNPLVLQDAFEVFGRHASEMANYHALAPVLTDIDRIFGYQQWTNGKRTGSVKESIENSMGRAGQKYWKNLIDQLNIGLQRESTPFSKLFSNFKAAKVGANLRVVVQQPLSYFRAGHAIDGKYLIAGLKGHTDTKIMEQYAPIAKWKSWGYSELDTGRQLSDILSGKKETAIERVKEASMWLPGKADEVTWKALWRAVEAETRHETNLTQGTDAFYTAVGERFTEIIDRTQVVDTVLNRSAMMRNGGMGHQIGTMFLAEPTLDYNEVLASYETVKTGKKGAGKQMLRGALWLALSGVAKAVVVSLVDAGRDKDEDETWTQKFRQALIGIEGDEQDWKAYTKNLVSGNLIESVNPVGWVPFLKDIYSLMQGFERKSPDTALAADLMKTCTRFYGAVTGQNNVALPAASVELLAKIADASGIPLSSLKREIESFINTILLVPSIQNSRAGQQLKFSFRRFHTKMTADNVREWVKYGQKNFTDAGMMEKFKHIMLEEQLATEQDFRDMQTAEKSKGLSELVSAWKEEIRNGNTKEAEEIVKQMDAMGYSDKKVQDRLSAAEQALLKETWNFKQRKSAHNVRITDRAAKSRQWKQLSTEQKEFFSARTAQYTAALALSEVDKSQKLEEMSTKWYAKARDAKTVGLSEEQFLVMWTVTKDIESLKDKDGKAIPNSRGLRMMREIYKTFPGLSEEQYIYLFDARNVPQKAMYTGDSKKHINNPARTKQLLSKLEQQEGK